jgi:hypothetical protein
MAKMKLENNVFMHDIMGDGTMVAKLDVGAVFPAIVSAGGVAKDALFFAIKTASRNATAGLLSSDKPAYNPAEAFKRVQARMDAWAKGVWQASSESSGEPRTSLLARAVAEAMGRTPEEAAEDISAVIDAALDEASLDKEDETQKAAVRKISTAIRNQLKSDIAVERIYKRLQREDAEKREKEVSTKTGESNLAGLLKR